MRTFAVHFQIRKGLGPDMMPKTIFVGLDDLDPEENELTIRKMAIDDAESQLYKTDDYPVYGKNWVFTDIQET